MPRTGKKPTPAGGEPALTATDVVRLQRAFSISECREITALAEGREHRPDQFRESGEVRGASLVCWLPARSAPDWLTERVSEMLADAATAYDFDISPPLEDFKLIHYRRGNRVAWHVDCGGGKTSTRKLTLTALLSSPNSFDGGKLTIPGQIRELHNDAGDVVIFPSYVSHKVTTVTRGARHSLIVWAHGPHFR